MLGKALGSSYDPSGLPETFSAFSGQDCTDSCAGLKEWELLLGKARSRCGLDISLDSVAAGCRAFPFCTYRNSHQRGARQVAH